MHNLLHFLVFLTFLLLDPVVNGQENANVTNEAPEVPPAVATVLINNLEDVELDKEKGKLEEKEPKVKCQHTDYRSYVKCLLQESKREKRQGYQQCSGASCAPQSCSGNGCLPANQQQCIGTGCLQLGQQQCVGTGCTQTVQQPCSGTGCLFFGYNCGGTGCTQIGQNCYGVGCAPPCTGSSCGTRPQPIIKPVDDEFRREIGSIRQELGFMKAQNERLIKEAERATAFILKLVNKPDQKPTVLREPVLVGHNSTTNIDINNYMNNHNVVNLPEVKRAVEKENETHCCVVVRPKTCRRTSRPPYFGCGHKRHRSCGTVCSGKRVVYSQVKPGCTGEDDENCVSYHPHPYPSTSYPGYPTSGYYPPSPIYYPIYAPPPMMFYPPPQMPIYTPPCEDCEDCEDCEVEVETEDCEDADADCRSRAKKDGGESTRVRSHRNVLPKDEIVLVEKEARAIERSEDQLSASIDMLEEAVELKKQDEERKEEEEVEKSLTKDKRIGVSKEPHASLSSTFIRDKSE